MRCYRLFLITFSIFFALACSNKQMSIQLHDIQSYIEDYPDSALTVLESIPLDALNTQELKAHYSLLHAMALDKNYIDTADVSIIEPAVLYYEKHGTADERMKAYYLQGIEYFNGEEYDKAIVAFTYAEEMIPKATDMRYVGLVYSRISDLYNRSNNNEVELKYVELAEDTFAKYGIKKYEYTTLLRKGEALAGLRKHNEAEAVYLRLIGDSEVPNYVKRWAKEDYALLLLAEKKRGAEKSLQLFREVISEYGGLRSVKYWSAYAFSLAACGYEDESERLFTQLYSQEVKDYSVVDMWKASACKSSGDYRQALSLLENTLSHQDSLVRISISQATMRAQKDYLALKNTQLQIDNKNHQLRSLIIIIILILVILALYLIYHFRSERLKRERVELIEVAETMRLRLKESEEGRVLEKVNLEGVVSSKESEISNLREEIENREKKLSALRSEYAHMYKSQFKYLGDLCETYLLANEKKDSQRIVYEKVQEMIKNIGSDKTGQRRFERMIDRSLNNIMKHFREEFPNYSEEEYRFVSYIFVGFDATTLCIIFNMPSVAAVYMKKSRIKKTIQESQARYKEEYLIMLG